MRTAPSLPRIYADERGLKRKELTEWIIGIFFNALGHGFLESVYDQAFSVVLADIDVAPEKQLRKHLRATDIEVGLLFNSGSPAQFRRHEFENARQNPRDPRESAEKNLPGSCR